MRSVAVVVILVVTVLNELEGLCRSRLAAESRAALAFLRDKNPQVRYVTSKGAPLPTLLAAGTVNEENDDQVRLFKDDLIHHHYIISTATTLPPLFSQSGACPPHSSRLSIDLIFFFFFFFFSFLLFLFHLFKALTNDDRILQCCLGLIKDKPGSAEDEHSQGMYTRRM